MNVTDKVEETDRNFCYMTLSFEEAVPFETDNTEDSFVDDA